MNPLQHDHHTAGAGVDLGPVDELLADELGDPHDSVDARRVESRPARSGDRTSGGWSYTAAADTGRVRGGMRREHPSPPRISHDSDRRPRGGVR